MNTTSDDIPAVPDLGAGTPIADYALLGDCQGAALVSRGGSVDWWCAPRFDSRSVFARILDPGAGHWSIRPIAEFEVERAYLEGTMVLRTTFHTAGGTVELTDALALAPRERGHQIGLSAPHVLVRSLEVVSGEVDLAVDFVPRLEYGLVVPAVERTENGLVTVGGPDTLLLAGEAPFEIEGGAARAELTLREGERAAFALHHREGMYGRVERPLDPARALSATIAGWRSWYELHTPYEGVYAEQVLRSALLLQALTYAPTGAVIAAPTTSLPEVVGGSSNWDYRYAWLRDASLTLKALWVAACPDEASRFLAWMARAGVRGSSEHVQIMFGVGGERDLAERELPHLAGYRGSAPVRIGNEAFKQKQLDVYGEVLDGAWVLREQLGELEPLTAQFLRGLADTVADTWREPDVGIWESRDEERHYTSSKVYCWAALDRAVKLAPQLGPEARAARWAAQRDEVRAAILEQAWSEELGAYAGALGSDRLDASVLLMPIIEFLPATDGRMRRTIDAIERELGDGRGLVRRWQGAEDGSFLICSFWLAQALALAGEVERARAVFDDVLSYANDVGLLSEEVDPERGELVGNFPQTFSHVGLINAAWAIEQAEQARRAEAEA